MTLLKIKNLNLSFKNSKGSIYALHNINLILEEGEILGIAGESGCGKTTLVHSFVKLLPPSNTKYTTGEIIFEKENLLTKKEKELTSYRGKKIAYIFQDPMTALNPTMKIGHQILEAIKEKRTKEKVYALLKEVELSNPFEKFKQYPHELSGGQRQRVMIAIALASNPKIIIADEPTTALDITIQAQILELFKNIQKARKISIILISHNLRILSALSTRIIIMYAGKIIEEGFSINDFVHPYTKLLLLSMPSFLSKDTKLHTIQGSPPDLSSLIKGCSFAARCPKAQKKLCFEKEPPLVKISAGKKVACWLYNPDFAENIL